MLCVWIVSR